MRNHTIWMIGLTLLGVAAISSMAVEVQAEENTSQPATVAPPADRVIPMPPYGNPGYLPPYYPNNGFGSPYGYPAAPYGYPPYAAYPYPPSPYYPGVAAPAPTKPAPEAAPAPEAQPQAAPETNVPSFQGRNGMLGLGMSGTTVIAEVERKLDFIKQMLKLSTAQETTWKEYADSALNQTKANLAIAKEMPTPATTNSAEWAKKHFELMESLHNSRKAAMEAYVKLFQVLDPTQRVIADRLSGLRL